MSVLLFTYSFAEQRKREIYHKEVVGSGIVRCLPSVGYYLPASGMDVVR